MNTTLKTLFAATCMTLATTGAAIAHQDEDGMPGKHCAKGHHADQRHMGMHTPGKPPYLHGITLSSEQEDKIFALNHAEIPKIRELMKQRQALHQELRQLSQTPQFDESKAKAVADKLANLEKEGVLNRARTESKVLALLTPEQREQAFKNMEEHKQNRGEHHPAGFRGQRQQHPDVRS